MGPADGPGLLAPAGEEVRDERDLEDVGGDGRRGVFSPRAARRRCRMRRTRSGRPVRRQTSVGAVATDVRYADTAPEGWREPLLDVYAPSGAKDLPLVVLFHGAPTAVDKTGSGLVDYPALAEEIASRGAVVVSANWGLYDAPMPADAQAWVASVDQGRDETACAISYAAAHAADWGADPQRLVVIGHSGGATQVSPTVLGEAKPVPGVRIRHRVGRQGCGPLGGRHAGRGSLRLAL